MTKLTDILAITGKPGLYKLVSRGNNMLIVSDYVTAFNNIKSAVENGIISESYLDYQLMPVLGLKVKKGLITQQ